MAAPLAGQVAVTGTAAALSTSTSEISVLLIQADWDNAAEVCVGPTGVTTSTGFKLTPGQELSLEYQNVSGDFVVEPKLTELFVVGSPGDGVSWLAWRR
jgi:hypothetical protein